MVCIYRNPSAKSLGPNTYKWPLGLFTQNQKRNNHRNLHIKIAAHLIIKGAYKSRRGWGRGGEYAKNHKQLLWLPNIT